MGYLEEQLTTLHAYLPDLTRRPDFDAFWRETRHKADCVPLRPTREVHAFPGNAADVYDISFRGFDETPIHGWYLVPKGLRAEDRVPCLIHYHGFTGHRGFPAEFLQWVSLGVSVLSVDCREQGGMTGNEAAFSSGYATNVACKGILDKNEYYFRAVYMDCVKAIDLALAQPETDSTRIIIEGGSQGGALGMAVCSLDARPWLAMVDVPSNSHLAKRVANGNGSFSSVTDYLKMWPQHLERALDTLSYFDTMNLADRIRCPVFASVALRDTVCPADCYFASYNRIHAEKEIRVYPFNGHEGGGPHHNEAKMNWLWQRLGTTRPADG